MTIRGRDGGLARGRVLREKALAKYYAVPRNCKQCGTTLRVPDRVKPSQFTNKFCNAACAATFNNANGIIPRRKPGIPKSVRPCAGCGEPFVPRAAGRAGDSRLHCSVACAKKTTRATVLARRKDEIFRNGRPWQPARSTIQRMARHVFFESDRPKICEICGYHWHIEVAHRIPVSAFPGHATLGEINDLSNLRALCPNHHWEYDNGVLVETGGIEPPRNGL